MNNIILLQLIALYMLLLPTAVNAEQQVGQAVISEVELCREGKALLPVVISAEAPKSVERSAIELADYLGRIGQAQFQLQRNAAAKAISIKVVAESNRPEHYTIRSTQRGVEIVGASALAVQHAVWDLLYRIGYRQYFPSANWEITPRLNVIKVKLNVEEQPDYRSRRVWYGFGLDTWNRNSYEQWVARNRMGGAFDLRTGHAWQSIVHRNKQIFTDHPEWLAFIDGKRVNNVGLEKFCIANSALREFVVQDVLKQAKANPDGDSISLDPSDGLGWCECERCLAIGTPSDRVIILANQAAVALEKAGFDRMHIGMYAYAGHAAAPKIKPHPKVIISIATAFSDKTPLETIQAWKQSGVKQFGIREYHSVVAWDHNLPGKSRGSNTEYLAQSIRDFYDQGARYYTSESGDCWGPNGFGHFLSARLLWDVTEANRVKELKHKFVEDCFGEAAKPMHQFYNLIDGANKPLMSNDLIGRMYRFIEQASTLTTDKAIKARLNDLALYTRHVELFYAYRQGSTERGINTLQFAWRIRNSGMAHTQALYRDVPHRDKKIVVPENASWSIPEQNNPWKSPKPVTGEEISKLIADGIRNNPLFDFKPIQFSGLLRPHNWEVNNNKLGSFGPRDRHHQQWYLWLPQTGKMQFDATTGIIPSYRNKVRNTRFELHTVGQPLDKMVDFKEVKPDGQKHSIHLSTMENGLHQLTMADAGAMTTLSFPESFIVTREASTQSPLHLNAGARVYFYVPRGTTKIGGYSSTNKPKLYPAESSWKQGQTIGPGYFSFKVPLEKDGQFWMIEVRSSGTDLILMTVPPYVARTPEQLLLPDQLLANEKR